jgi:hypothetical protein
MRTIESLTVLSLIAGLSGCGSNEIKPTLEKVVPVSGTLTYQGKPLENYQVSFIPTDGRRAAVGITDVAGRFTLGTNDIGDGAPPGKHKVSVTFAPPSPDDSATSSPVDDPELLPKPKVAIPKKYGNPETSGLQQEVPSGGLTDLKLDLK